MKRALELLLAAILMLLLPVIAGHPVAPAPYVDPFGGTAFAVQPDEMLPDPAMERRARTISAELRCLVCQNQSIDDSDADLARDLRLLVRDRLRAGDADAAVLDYVVARYGEFVLLKPKFGLATALLWGAPILLLLGGLAYLLSASRRKDAPGDPVAALTAEEAAAVERLLAAREDRPQAAANGGRAP